MNEQNNDTAIQKRITVQSMLMTDKFKAALAAVLPAHMTAERMARVALASIAKTPTLAKCTIESFGSAMMTLSQLGLEPDGRCAHLIPYGTECQLIIDYKGFVSLIMRTGLVSNIHADVVCANDKFRYNLGLVEEHSIDFAKPRGEVYATYCVITMKDGTKKSEVMSVADVEAIRRRSKTANKGPWVTDWNEMAKKTVFRRASKWVPLEGSVSVHAAHALSEAVAIDDMQFEKMTEARETEMIEGSKLDTMTAKLKGKVIQQEAEPQEGQ